MNTFRMTTCLGLIDSGEKPIRNNAYQLYYVFLQQGEEKIISAFSCLHQLSSWTNHRSAFACQPFNKFDIFILDHYHRLKLSPRMLQCIQANTNDLCLPFLKLQKLLHQFRSIFADIHSRGKVWKRRLDRTRSRFQIF